MKTLDNYHVAGFGGQLVSYTPKLNSLISRAAVLVGVHSEVTVASLIQQLDPTKYLGVVAKGLQNFTSTAGFVLVYAAFIIASRQAFERKLVMLFRTREERQDAVQAFLRIEQDLIRVSREFSK